MGLFKDFSRNEIAGGVLVDVVDYGGEVQMVYHMADGSERIHRMYFSGDRVFEREDIEVVSREEKEDNQRWFEELIGN